ncbi:MAG: DUF5119 domain-containing protein [Bacteroidales bacterium]
MKYILMLLLMIVSSACEMDQLFFATNERSVIRLNVDWSSSRLSPNGATVYVFDQKGQKFEDYLIFNNPNQLDISLPKGSYQLLVFNNTHSELNNVEIVNDNSISSFEFRSKEMIPKFSEESKDVNEKFVSEPDTMAISFIEDVEITSEMIQYYPYKPDVNGYKVANEYNLKTKRIISVADIKVHVLGLKYAAGAPISYLRNMSASYLLDKRSTSNQIVTHQFILNNRKFDEGSNENGTIRKQLTTFGLLTADSKNDQKYYLTMNFILINGESYPIHLDITNNIKSIQDIHTIHSIDLEVSLPEVIGEQQGGAFNPDLEEWEDVEIELPVK